MPRAYKAPNKRIIQRAGNGRFRQSTLSDIGLGCCEVCGQIFAPDFSSMGEFIDPRDFNRARRFCPEHLKEA